MISKLRDWEHTNHHLKQVNVVRDCSRLSSRIDAQDGIKQ
jgi:hypothetical protein